METEFPIIARRDVKYTHHYDIEVETALGDWMQIDRARTLWDAEEKCRWQRYYGKNVRIIDNAEK